ncbi:MAG: hypothetical protein NXH78_11875 [Hyphomonadaceae bacterium]|nr:hypothetical protein [Hyphomonadaceae bacterium]
MNKATLGLISIVLLAACGGRDGSPTVRLEVEAAPAVTAPVEVEAVTPALPETVEAKISAIRDVLARDSLSRLVRLADAEESFVSNFAGESHRVHWDLLRRTGFDPLAKLGGLLDGPYGTRQVGDQTWYIWPDFAALEADELLPEKLTFTDRARLRDLVGEPGLERIRAGEDYPGVRTAIAGDGDWLYFVHETQQDTEEAE